MVASREKKELTLGHKLSRDYKLNKWKYVLILPVLVYLALFAYKPMYGLVIVFKNYKTTRGIAGSEIVPVRGAEHPSVHRAGTSGKAAEGGLRP